MGETELGPDSVVRRRMEARVRKYRGSLFIAVRDQALELDEVAQAIFRRIDSTSTLREIAARLAEEYDIPVDEATGDTVDFVAQLVGHGVVEVVQ
ncbi:PqqD family protein [Streptomyces sp. XM83C]|jgi:pyrroloquinoline quinone biosynthesis protein D|uniref:PqqD family protein n=1 Tax=Streptomyces thermocoprophilus TaxID=78356 RepID=A0ABV5VCZ5_9ACTN|nr:PqqD family protein [Streptomyces sp. XM83C]MCK1819766.1 PqqD family protein [Streptomyces sp. XM83C]